MPRTILHVDDDTANTGLVQRLLRDREHVSVVAAASGRDGVDLAREHRPDLILLDMQLPDMSGEQVLGLLVAGSETRDIPVVIVSADASPATVRRLLECGAREYLTKPFDRAALSAVVDRWVNEP